MGTSSSTYFCTSTCNALSIFCSPTQFEPFYFSFSRLILQTFITMKKRNDPTLYLPSKRGECCFVPSVSLCQCLHFVRVLPDPTSSITPSLLQVTVFLFDGLWKHFLQAVYFCVDGLLREETENKLGPACIDNIRQLNLILTLLAFTMTGETTTQRINKFTYTIADIPVEY